MERFPDNFTSSCQRPWFAMMDVILVSFFTKVCPLEVLQRVCKCSDGDGSTSESWHDVIDRSLTERAELCQQDESYAQAKGMADDLKQ